MTIEDRVKKIVEQHLTMGPDYEYKINDTWADRDADSLDSVSLVMAIEEEFNVEITDEDAEKIYTPAQAIEYLKGRKVE